jgi:endonuclease YncB( thermonuclease family)
VTSREGRKVIHELDTVVLARDIEEYGLKKGDVGAVVHCYSDGDTFEVEFVTAEGRTLALLTLDRKDIRPMTGREILHVRELAPVAA